MLVEMVCIKRVGGLNLREAAVASKNLRKGSFYGEKLYCGRCYVNLDERGWVCWWIFLDILDISESVNWGRGLPSYSSLFFFLFFSSGHVYIVANHNHLLSHLKAWISEKQRLPVKKNSWKARLYGEEFHHGMFYDRLERGYVICVHIDVNLVGRGWVCCCSTSNSQKRKWWRSCLKSRPHAI